MGVLALDDQDRVIDWQEKPEQPKSDLASMGVYVFSKRALRRWLSDDLTDFGTNVIPAMLEGGARVFGYRFDGYWQDVGTIQSLWEANMALLDDEHRRLRSVRSGMADPHPVGGTRAGQDRSHRAGAPEPDLARLCDQRDGRQQRPVTRRAQVDVGAVVRDSIVMFDSVIRSGAVVDRAILDKEVVIGQGAIVGDGPDFDTPNKAEPGRLNTGITVVGKRWW